MDVKVLSPYKNIIIGMIIIIAFAAVVQGTFSQYSLQEKEIEAKMRELEDREKTIERWGKLRLEREALGDSFLTEDTLFFKKFVEEKANDSGINIISLKTSNAEKDLFWETTMQLSIICSYEDFIVFIKAIEEKSVVIEKVGIKNRSGMRNTAVSLTLKGFILKER